MIRSRVLAVLFAVVFWLLPFGGFLCQDTSGDGTGSYPPPPVGDWVITNETYVGNETIVLTGNLTVQSNASLTLSNVTLKMNASVSGEFKIYVLPGGSLTISDSNITALTEDGNHNYGFLAEAGSNLSILSSEIHYVGWNMDFTQGHGIILRTPNATIRDSTISHSYAGLTINGVSTPPTIVNNTISWNKRNGITAIESNVNLTGNTVFYNGLIMDPSWGPYAGHGITLANSTTGVVYDNDLNENYWDGLFVYLSSDVTIKGNRILRNQNEGAEIYGANGMLFEENNASETVFYSGLTLWYSDYNTIKNNIFFGNGNNGLYMYRSWDNDIMNNTAIGSQRFHAFSIKESHLNTLVGNTGLSAAWCGVWMGQSRGNSLMWNNFSSNNWAGVYISGGFGGNTLMFNNISGNQVHGVQIDSSSSNQLVSNNISVNQYGISLMMSMDNTIIWNNIISNQIQALDDRADNIWDAGYPLGGNYWSDYGGSDFFRGVDQDQPGGDGIGDTPYVIDSDSEDEYPLVAPFNATKARPPTNVTAILSGDSLENVTIRWNVSLFDESMGIISNYAVYYAKEYDPNGTNYLFLGEIPAGNSSYVHVDGGYGDPNSYYYMVVANTTFGTTTNGGNQAGKFTRNLKTGLNLVSYPLILEERYLESVLKTVNFTEIWHYDAHSVDSKWKSYSERKGYGTFPELDHRKAYWINISEESNFTVAGMVPLRSYIDLKSGWNLVGYPSAINRTSNQTLGGVPVAEIEGFDESASPYFLKRIGLNDELIAGYGYWIRVDSDSTWIVDNL